MAETCSPSSWWKKTLYFIAGVLLATLVWYGRTQATGSAHTQSAPGPPKSDAHASLTIQTYDGGSAVTELGYGIAINKGSSLHRRWYVINDSTCPVNLGAVGIKPVYQTSRGSGYSFDPVGEMTPKAAVSAIQVIFVQFNLWGDRERNLAATEIKDLQLGQSFKIEGRWYATENDVSEQLTSVAYVRSAMTADGKIWRADLDKIAALLRSVALTVSASGLESEPRKEPEKK